ncbi:DUF5065 family protein [Bacillus wiedmannii]|uniref:DUF5065 family protein n=1 Tax=Bacillus wiedmannii TaxID=1890302 RepID=UPI001482667F|nr:DUF5065 family protein [Bacillus wiedmannii]
MKKLSKVALIGALTFGGFTAVEMIKPASQAQAATVKASDPFNDEWGITNTQILYDFIPFMSDQLIWQVDSSYKTGDRFQVVRYVTQEDPTDVMKIFKIEDNGKLTRLKTMDPTYWVDPVDNRKYQTWETWMTDVYLPGKYVAIGFIDGQHQQSKPFTINK